MINRQKKRIEELSYFLNRATTGALSTVTDLNEPSIAIVFFCNVDEDLIFKSRTTSGHSTNLALCGMASMSVYYHKSNYDSKYGVQLIGEVSRIRDVEEMKKAVLKFSENFKGSEKKLPSNEELCSEGVSSTFYKFKIGSFKIVDEGFGDNRTMLKYQNFIP